MRECVRVSCAYKFVGRLWPRGRPHDGCLRRHGVFPPCVSAPSRAAPRQALLMLTVDNSRRALATHTCTLTHSRGNITSLDVAVWFSSTAHARCMSQEERVLRVLLPNMQRFYIWRRTTEKPQIGDVGVVGWRARAAACWE